MSGSRLNKVPVSQWDPRLKALSKPEQATELEQGLMRFLAHQPELALGLAAVGGALKTKRSLPDRLVELVRLRVAFFNQCRSCMAIRYTDAIADGLTEAQVCSLEKPQEASDLSPAEKAAVHFGELMATDHLAIDDQVYADLRHHFSEAQIVELGMQAAFFVGFGRLAATFNMVEELPASFQDDSAPASPWNSESITVR